MSEEDPIQILLVDDDRRWAEFMAQELERQSPDLAVTVATSANEALQQLHKTVDYECIVTDYPIPDITGIELLERIRNEAIEIPFILLIGEGDEDLEAKAIRAGASDYLLKDPRTAQISLIGQRIRTAVRQYRLEESLDESEERYRTVTEQSSDAILVVQDGATVLCNQQLCNLVGYDESELEAVDFVTTILHPDDQEEAQSAIEDCYDGSDVVPLQEARIVTATEEIRHWELAGRAITYEAAPALLISARDITERNRRTRELEWHQNVQQALIKSRTRQEFEKRICEQLCQYGYELAWSGPVLDGQIHPQVVESGANAYVDSFTFALGESRNSEPSGGTTQTREPQFIDDFTDLCAASWRDAALEAGYQSGAALPLLYGDIRYGMFGVYNTEPDQFDESERSLLVSLAETMAFAIHSFETQRALSSQHAAELVLQLNDPEYYLIKLARHSAFRAENSRIVVEGTIHRSDNQVLQYVSVDGVSCETFYDLASNYPSVESVAVISETEGRLKTIVNELTPESRLAELGAVVRETSVTSTGAKLHIELPTTRDARDVINQFKEIFPSVSLESLVETDLENRTTGGQRSIDGAEFTHKQAESLRVAYLQGYFDTPRKSNATEVANALGVSHSTFLQHLRAAQKKVFSDL